MDNVTVARNATGVTRVSFRKLLGLTEEVPEVDYSLLVKLPDLLSWGKLQRDALLDIEVEDFRVVHERSKPSIIKLRSLGHSQHANVDVAFGKRFGSFPCIIVIPDINASQCWYDSIEMCIALFLAGNDILWLHFDQSNNEPGHYHRLLRDALPAVLSHFRITNFSTLSFGASASFVISQLELTQGKHACFFPETVRDEAVKRLVAELRTSLPLQFSLFVEEKSSFEVIAEAFNAERLASMRSGQKLQGSISINETARMTALAIPGDSMGRSVLRFCAGVQEKVLEFMKVYLLSFLSFGFRDKCFSEG